MAVDPRLADVTASGPPGTRQAARVVALERRLARLEAGGRRVPIGLGPPTAVVPDGALYVDSTPGAPRLWVRVGGAWKSTALT